MFINQAEPLIKTTVRLAGTDRDYVTNDEGKVEIDLAPGSYTFEIWLGHEKVTRTIQRKGESTLFIVDATRTSDAGITTMNTLQMDIAHLVGDRYVFETVLGRGGMGVVVKAIDRLLNRPVAIKMLSDELRENEEAQQIFLVEARNLATLSHPNLVAIHDILNVDGRVLMVFEYVLGQNLEKHVEMKGPMKQMDALRMAIQLTRVVAYLHDHELIHRDLKPSNVLMQADGTLKLVDFGLARSLNDLYVRGTRVRGTPAYMAPEQIMGIHLTVATDVYQIGITLFEALVGELPFPKGDMAYAHVHVDPPKLAERRPDLDPELQALVDQCLEKQPKDRPQTARTLLEKLSGIYSRLANEYEPAGLAENSVSVPGFDELHSSSSSRDFRAVSRTSDMEVEAHFSDMESGEIDILVTEPSEASEDTKKAPVVLISAIAAGLLIFGIGFIWLQSQSPDANAEQRTEVQVATEAKQKPEETEPKEEPVEAPTQAAIAPAEPELPSDAIAEPEVEAKAEPVAAPAARPVVNTRPAPAPKVRPPNPEPKQVAVPEPEPEPEPAPKVVAQPKPAEKKSDDLSVDTFKIDDKKKSKGLLKVEPSSKGGLLPVAE